MDVISAARQPPEPEETLERGLEDDATVPRRTGRTLEVHLLTFIKKMRRRSRSSTTKLVVQEEGVLLPPSEACAAVADKDVQGPLAEVATLYVALYAAAEGLEDEAIAVDGGTGKR